MAKIEKRQIIHEGPIKNAPGSQGKDIGYQRLAIPFMVIYVDVDTLHEKYVKITSPDPWYQSENKETGWIELAHTKLFEDTVPQLPNQSILLIDWDEHTVTVTPAVK